MLRPADHLQKVPIGYSLQMERVMGLEPTISAWKANVLPLHYTRKYLPYIKLFGAGDGARTRHLRLGKAALYQMSYYLELVLYRLVPKAGLEPARGLILAGF